MSFDSASVLFFLLSSAALLALSLSRTRTPQNRRGDAYVWLAQMAALLHPLAWAIADAFAMQVDLTPLLAFDLIAACAIAAAAADGPPGGKAFVPVAALAAMAFFVGVQQLPLRGDSGAGVSAPLMSAVLLCTAFIGSATECYRHARLHRIVRHPIVMLALLSVLAAMLQLLVALVAATSQASELVGSQLLAATGIGWLVLKLMLISTLLKLLSARRAEVSDRVSRQLVAKANAATHELLVVAQAFYQLPGNVLVTDDGGRILFINAQARRMLAYPETKECVLEDLFIAVQPSGHQQVRALFEKPGHHVELMQIRMTDVECGGESHHLLQLETLPFSYDMLRGLLVDSRNDAPHEASGLLDHHFAIAAMADGWFRLLDPVDRYAASGLFWDKLRLLSDSDSEIAYLENSIATGHEAQGWLMIRQGGSLSVAIRKLQTPDYKLFYRIQITLLDDASQTRFHAPCADDRKKNQ